MSACLPVSASACLCLHVPACVCLRLSLSVCLCPFVCLSGPLDPGPGKAKRTLKAIIMQNKETDNAGGINKKNSKLHGQKPAVNTKKLRPLCPPNVINSKCTRCAPPLHPLRPPARQVARCAAKCAGCASPPLRPLRPPTRQQCKLFH